MRTKNKHVSVSRQYQKRSKGGEIWHYFSRNGGAMTGLIFLIVLCVVALTVDMWLDPSLVTGINVREKLLSPSLQHLFGTDEMGRDLFWRCVYATKYSLSIGFVSVMVSVVIGVPLGAIAGFFSGMVDEVIMRITDIFSAIPSILMAVVVVSMLGTDTINLMIAVGISATPHFIRITRASILTVKNQEYVEAARALGKTNVYVIFRHALPNCLSPIIVQVTLKIANAIISAAGLSFLGLGIKPPTPEWGALLSAGKTFVRGYSYLTLFPGLCIMLTVLAFNLVGDGLRDAMDPKLHK